MASSGTNIAKNTLFMYFRMALITIVGLYSARVILNALGVVDYGIYNVAGSVVAMFGFLNGALAISSSRFLTIELGKTSQVSRNRLERCFATTRAIHAILAIGIFLIAETIGLWILNTKCEIPAERINAAMWVYQISVLTSLLSITLVPFSSMIVAYEHMKIYAYIGIIEAFFKLLICYLIQISPFDNLIFYAILVFVIQLCVYLFNRIYCKIKFEVCRDYKYSLDKEFLRPILSFSGWNLLGSFSYMAITQAATIVVSIFFGPAVVAARTIATQVKNHILNFINNFRVSVNPQILKKHAANDLEGSKKLIFISTNISFYLLLLILLPFLLEADFILKLWLKNVPDFTVEFTQITIFELMVSVYDASFYMIFQAYGRLKENALICSVTDLLTMIIVCIIYYFGGHILTIAWAILILSVIQGMYIKPMLAFRLFGYCSKDFLAVYATNAKVLIASSIIPLIVYYFFNDYLIGKFAVMFTSVVCVCLSSYYIGFSHEDRMRFRELILLKIKEKFIKK